MEEVIVCPFTSKKLSQLTEQDLSDLNQRIVNNELFFQVGVPLKFPIQAGYISHDRVYVYAVIEGVLLLQKQTAIVERNRMNNPQRRISEGATEAFYQGLGIGGDGTFTRAQAEAKPEPVITPEHMKSVASAISKEGFCLITANTALTDEVRNLIFGRNFQYHLHMDHDIDRLRRVEGELSSYTQYILCDPEVVPVADDAVDSYCSFNTVSNQPKEVQVELYNALKRTLKSRGNAICLLDEAARNYIASSYKADSLAAKLKPWKKNALPAFRFYKVAYKASGRSVISDERSFGSQLSKV
jgi:hypothetical protein